MATAGTSRPCSLAASTAAPKSTPAIDRPEPLPTPCSSMAMTIAGRPELFLQSPGDDADDAGCQPSPATTATARSLAIIASAAYCTRFRSGGVVVEAVELFGDRAGFGGVLGGEQAYAEVRAADAATRVDAGPQCEAEVAAVGARVRRDAWISASRPMLRRAAHDLQPLRATKARLRRAIARRRRRCERDDVEMVDEPGFGAAGEEATAAQLADQRGGEQEADADGGEVAVRGAFVLVEPVGIDQSMRAGEGGRRICDGRRRRRRPGGRAPWRARRMPARRNRRDDQRGAFVGQADERVARRAIAFEQAVGDIGARLDPRVAQDEDEKGGGGGAVDVIIAEDGDALTASTASARRTRRGPCRERPRGRA